MLEFHVWYMKEKGWIERTDTGAYAITAAGVDAVEESDALFSDDRLLPAPAGPDNQGKAYRPPNRFNPKDRRLTPNPC